MTNLPNLPEKYNPEEDRFLMDASRDFLEIENAFSFPSTLRNRWVNDLVSNLCTVSESQTHSYYFDTPQLCLYANGKTLRVRPGGVSRVMNGKQKMSADEVFPNQFALKSRNLEFHAVANEIAYKLYPDFKSCGIYPVVRDEFEGSHNWPQNINQLRFSDLPNKKWVGHRFTITSIVQDLIGASKLKGVSHSNDLVLIPWVATTVRRSRTLLYLSPQQEYDFNTSWPSPSPTQEMLDTGKYLCLEVALDQCVYRGSPTNENIDAIIRTKGTDFRRFAYFGKRSLIEYELKSSRSGHCLTDAEAIKAYVAFGHGIRKYAEMRQKNSAKKNAPFLLVPTRSKASTAYGLHPLCQNGASLHEVYDKGLPFAP